MIDETQIKHHEIKNRRWILINEMQTKYYKISLSMGENIIKHTSVIVNNYANVYDSTALKKYDLAPRYMLELDNKTIFISRIFLGRGDDDLQSGHPRVILYIENGEGGFIARSFYRSKSQRTWRLLPGVFRDFYHYKTLYGEQAINAPIKLQKVLDELHIAYYMSCISEMDGCHPPLDIGGFGGDDTDDFDNAFEKEIQERSWAGGKRKVRKDVLSAPEELILDSEESPDFSHILMSWQDVDGNIKQVFVSKNRGLKYEFLTDKNGRSCLALVECADAKINSFGLRDHFIQTGDFTMPLYEYGRQTKGDKMNYSDLDDELHPYYGMWRRYLSQIPLIREYTNYLHSHGYLTADCDDVAGQIEEDKIYKIFCKIIKKEPLTTQEVDFMCRPAEQFLHPMTVKNAQKNLRSVVQKRERLKVILLDTKRMSPEALARLLVYHCS